MALPRFANAEFPKPDCGVERDQRQKMNKQFQILNPINIALGIVLLGAALFVFNSYTARTATDTSKKEDAPSMPSRTFQKPSDAEIKKMLNPIQYQVTQRAETEPPFQNDFWDNHDAGLYVDIVTGEPLFSSTHKFNSGTGWPSFTRPVEPQRVTSLIDATHGMDRTEVRSKAGDSHLGHVFTDGPKPAGLRYCINSASLRFIPADSLAAQGYGEYRKLFDGAPAPIQDATDNACALPKKGQAPGCAATIDVAVLSGGCFWGMQDLLRAVPGVIATEVGYAGGTVANPTYPVVRSGLSGHAESIKVTFDTSKLSYADLLEKWFFKIHDPTTLNSQGNDVGSQYRSAIFYANDAQKKIAEEVKARVDASGHWKRPVVTEIAKAGKFTSAEEYHQDYLKKNPGGYTCHYLREWKEPK